MSDSFRPGMLVRYPMDLPNMEFPAADRDGNAFKVNGKLYAWNDVEPGQIGIYIRSLDKLFTNEHLVLFGEVLTLMMSIDIEAV